MSAKLNDRDLRRQALVLDDPRDQAGLVYQIGQGVGLLDVLNIYRYSGYPRQKIYCAQCRGHHHARGFTALTSEGNRILLGSKCGADAFGESWKTAENRMKDRVARQYELHRLDRFELIYKPLHAALMTWTRPIEDLAWRHIGFRETLGELYSRAREAAFRDDGQLIIYKRVMKRQASDSAWAATPYARMRGADMFTGFDRMNVVLVVEQAIKAIDEMARGISNTDIISMQAMRARRVKMERLFEQLGDVAKAYEGGQDFFSDASFKLLSEWSFARDDPDHRYEYRRGVLQHLDGGAIVQKRPLPDLDGDILDLIQEYRRAD